MEGGRLWDRALWKVHTWQIEHTRNSPKRNKEAGKSNYVSRVFQFPHSRSASSRRTFLTPLLPLLLHELRMPLVLL
jgi:hypothetical protein